MTYPRSVSHDIYLDPDSPMAREAAEVARSVISARLASMDSAVMSPLITEVAHRVTGDPEFAAYLVAALALFAAVAVSGIAIEQGRDDLAVMQGMSLDAERRGWTI